MVVPDTSAWVEYLRRTESAFDLTITDLIDRREEIAVTECVVMEVLAGFRLPRDLSSVEALMMSFPLLPLAGVTDYLDAAALYRTCRRAGETIRKMTDCLIAIPVMRAGAELLHNDSDFEAIARHSELRIYSADDHER